MDGKPVRMICRTCGSGRVARDAWAEWDIDRQTWVLGPVFDYAFCHDCEDETRIKEHPVVPAQAGA